MEFSLNEQNSIVYCIEIPEIARKKAYKRQLKAKIIELHAVVCALGCNRPW